MILFFNCEDATTAQNFFVKKDREVDLMKNREEISPYNSCSGSNPFSFSEPL